MKVKYAHDEVANIVKTSVLPHMKPGAVITLTGPLGAGKTTLVKELLTQCGVEGPVTSPTFAYVNTYKSGVGVVHHFDLYRVSSREEFSSLGFEDYFTDDACVLVEWPDVARSFLAQRPLVVSVHISYDPETLDVRVLEVRHEQHED